MKSTVELVMTCLMVWPLVGQTKNDIVFTPAYPSTAPELRTLTSRVELKYVEQEFTPPFSVVTSQRPAGAFQTPEETMEMRAWAMGNQDYNAWLSTWDEAARARFQVDDPNPEAIAERKRQWAAMFSVSRMVLFKRIETQQFVIITYKMIDGQGRNVGQFELPSIFQKRGGRWLGTQELAASPLLIESPWITQRSLIQREIK